MSNHPKKILLDLLGIIGYQNNKEEFVSKFLHLIEQDADITVLETFANEGKEHFKQSLSSAATDAEKMKLISKYIQKDVYNSQLKASAEKIMKGYLQEIIPTLTDEQKQKVNAYFSSAPTS